MFYATAFGWAPIARRPAATEPVPMQGAEGDLFEFRFDHIQIYFRFRKGLPEGLRINQPLFGTQNSSFGSPDVGLKEDVEHPQSLCE